MKRNKIIVGDVVIGDNDNIPIQTMWKESSYDNMEDVLQKLREYKAIGCDIIRFAVPEEKHAAVLGSISSHEIMPIVADIHFNHKIALRCLDFNIAKIRINPGNIGAEWKVREIVKKAIDKNVPIRCGINGGSLPKNLSNEKDMATAMVKAAEHEIELLEGEGFSKTVISLKASDPDTTIRANSIFAEKYDYPLHIGVTEAGPLIPGLVKNTAALVPLLKNNIGATIRVSLSDTSEKEIMGAKEILRAAGKFRRGINIVSCPLCSRATFDVHGFCADIESELQRVKINKTVAVMGCVVNGPGEARHADLGITGVGNKVVIFKQGKVIHNTDTEHARVIFLKELDLLK